MKSIEYYYNLIYYFYYRSFIIIGLYLRKYNPLIIFIYLFYKIPFIKNRFKYKGIDDPFSWHMGYDKKIDWLENKELGIAVLYGGGFVIISLTFIYIGFYQITKNMLFPVFEDSFGYVLTISFILAFITDILFVQMNDKGKKI